MASSMASWQTDPLLVVEHLTMRFGGLVAVNSLSFSVGRRDITALIGPNGAGKTTVFNCVTGFYKPTEGRLALARHGIAALPDVEHLTGTGSRHGKSNSGDIYLLERMPGHEIANKARVARTFQNIRLFTGMTVLENLLVAQHNALMRASGFTVGGILGSWGSGATGPRRRPPSPRRPRGSTASGCSPAPTTPRATSPTATSAGSRSPGPCAPTRSCSASTSPRQASTRASRSNSTRCCARSATTTAPPCC